MGGSVAWACEAGWFRPVSRGSPGPNNLPGVQFNAVHLALKAGKTFAEFLEGQQKADGCTVGVTKTRSPA
jgi:hypothetical protein